MFRPAALIALGLGLSTALPAMAWDGVGPRPGFAVVNAGTAARWHEPRPARRHWVPAVVERREPQVTVVIQQVFNPPPVAVTLPTVLDLPVQAGIREAAPAQPAVYVLNGEERHPVRTGSIRLSAGPRIIDTGADMERPTPAFGARIIHLTVPVGGSD